MKLWSCFHSSSLCRNLAELGIITEGIEKDQRWRYQSSTNQQDDRPEKKQSEEIGATGL